MVTESQRRESRLGEDADLLEVRQPAMKHVMERSPGDESVVSSTVHPL
jgi:hypothetical protein